MFDQRPDQGAPDQAPAPVGMRELPPQPPSRPVMPAWPATPVVLAPELPVHDAAPGPDDSVIARDDHLEGTFTSRGTVRVLGTVKGRIEAVRLHVEDGARVEADVVVDEAVVAGEFVGSLTCRQRLEARPTGRLSGKVETYRVMLHEGASVEGEVHMLPEPARSGTDTIRGSAPVRGVLPESGPDKTSEAKAIHATPSAEAKGRDEARAISPAFEMPTESQTAGAPRITPRSAARAASVTSSTETVQVAPRAATPVSNGAGSGF